MKAVSLAATLSAEDGPARPKNSNRTIEFVGGSTTEMLPSTDVVTTWRVRVPPVVVTVTATFCPTSGLRSDRRSFVPVIAP
jgi:hypothetical protein